MARTPGRIGSGSKLDELLSPRQSTFKISRQQAKAGLETNIKAVILIDHQADKLEGGARRPGPRPNENVKASERAAALKRIKEFAQQGLGLNALGMLSHKTAPGDPKKQRALAMKIVTAAAPASTTAAIVPPITFGWCWSLRTSTSAPP